MVRAITVIATRSWKGAKVKMNTRSTRSVAWLLATSALLYACGGADEALVSSASAGAAGVNTENITARKWSTNLPNGNDWKPAATSSTQTTASTTDGTSPTSTAITEPVSTSSTAATTSTADPVNTTSTNSTTAVSTSSTVQVNEQVATDTTAAASTVASQNAMTTACRIKGNYIFFEDSEARGIAGYPQVERFLARNDIANFRGVGVWMDWASIERAPGQYDWSRLDAITRLVSGSNRRYYITPTERSFHNVCSSTSGVVPSFIPTEGSGETGYHVKCIAKIWEPAVMDKYIALHKAIVDHYRNDPNFIGFMGRELTARTTSLLNGGWRSLMKPQWIRLYREIAAYAPDLMIGNSMGWVAYQDQEELASILDGLGGGMLTWSDTFAPGYGGGYSGEGYIDAAEGSTYGWYNTARTRNSNMIIMPQVQTPFIPSTLAAHDYIYNFLNDSIKATAIVWAPWHASDSNYIGNVVIPTVNKYRGELSSPACPG